MRAMSLMMLALLAVSGGASAAAEPEAAQDLSTASTADLARRLLPPELASTVVGHEVPERHFPLRSEVLFYGPPAPYPDGTCRRDRHYVTVPRAGEAPSPITTVQLALAPGCDMPDGAFFGHLQPSQLFDEALAALHRFKEARAAAGGAGALPFELACETFQGPGECVQGPRKILAGLPLHQVYIVQPNHNGGWNISVMPSGPGQLYWKVLMTEDPAGRLARIAMRWAAPHPF